MLDLPFRTTSAITTPVADVVRRAKHAVWGTNPVHLNQRDDDAILGFGTDAPVRTLSPSQIITFPAALEMVTAALHRVKGTYPDIPAKTLFLDIETHNAGREYDMPLEDFFRLGQYAWGWDGDIVLTTDLADVLAQIEEADLIVAHNGLGFDFRVLLGNEMVDYAHQRRLLDTFVLGNLVFPAPDTFIMRNGHRQSQGDSPSGTMKWLSLDNLCFQLNVGGKEGDLKALARLHNPPKTKTEDLDFSLIPVDDPDFLAYARQDIVSLRDVTRDILNARPMQEYDWRDHMRTAIDAQMTINGILLDRDLAQARVDELAAKRGELLTRLSADYDFPTTGKMPWRSSVGKDAIFKILSDNGITLFTRPNWKRSEKTGVPSLGGEVLVQITEGTDAEELGTMLAQLMGQRPLAQQALDYCAKDGRVHCSYSGLQRSGRRSSTKVGLTTWTARGPGAEEKAYFIAPPGHSMLEMDLSNADQRIVAALSGDKEYAKRFEEGVDGHEINGRLMFGDRLYDTDPAHHRGLSKPCLVGGSLVDTDQGPVPIERVTRAMRVWDGENYVTHGGMVYSGVKEVITHDGITGTADHVVFIDGPAGTLLEVPLGVAAKRNHPIAKTRPGRGDVRHGNDHQFGKPVQGVSQAFVRGDSVRRVSDVGMGGLRESEVRENFRVSELCHGHAETVSGVVGPAHDRYQSAVREPEQSEVSPLRGSRGEIRVPFGSRGGNLRVGGPGAIRQVAYLGPDRHELGVRTGESETGDILATEWEQEGHGPVGVPPGTLAVRVRDRGSVSPSRVHTGRDNRGSEGTSSLEGVALSTRRGKARVYDILDAGPHNRFSVRGRLVHNCGHALPYGAGVNKLHETANRKLADSDKIPLENIQRFVDGFMKKYPGVAKWMTKVREEGESGWVTNAWGRRMPIGNWTNPKNGEVKSRSWTQSPALHGQSGTNEILTDGLISMYEYDKRLILWLSATIHDAILMTVPDEFVGYVQKTVPKLVEQKFRGIDFPLESGKPASNWFLAGH